ncbi:hypothetical protein GCM10010439_22890 [Actinocorallia aurantiaca]|uniref:Methyltransferase domain-containing protein n=1 Tax=Actinocorallia aurantiaca TaxID=46204 RepID=A0ABN3U5P9_9ACTN
MFKHGGVSAAGSPVVLELGPGTGSFTSAIQRRLAGRGHRLAIEINERFAAAVSAGFPGVTVAVGDAHDLQVILKTNGHQRSPLSRFPTAPCERTRPRLSSVSAAGHAFALRPRERPSHADGRAPLSVMESGRGGEVYGRHGWGSCRTGGGTRG